MNFQNKDELLSGIGLLTTVLYTIFGIIWTFSVMPALAASIFGALHLTLVVYLMFFMPNDPEVYILVPPKEEDKKGEED